MAIKIANTTVINDSRQLQNIIELDATTIATINANVPQGDITEVAAGGGLTGGGTSGTVTLSHADTSSQGSVDNSGSAVIQDVTLDTYGHITGLGSATLTASTISASASVDIQEFTSAGTSTWTKPSGAKFVLIRAIGGGGGGGSGAIYNTLTDGTSGGEGGTAGAFIEVIVPASLLGSTATVVVGAGGTGGAGRTGTVISGLAGTTGGNTTVSFSNVNNGSLVARGGNYGRGGTANSSNFLGTKPGFRAVLYPYADFAAQSFATPSTLPLYGWPSTNTGNSNAFIRGFQGPGAGRQGEWYLYTTKVGFGGGSGPLVGGRGACIIRDEAGDLGLSNGTSYSGPAGFGGDGGNGSASTNDTNSSAGSAGNGKGAGGGGSGAVLALSGSRSSGAGGNGAPGYVMMVTFF